MRTILFTGFPGFIGRRIVHALLAGDAETRVVCLVQPKFLAQARTEADRIATTLVLGSGRLTTLPGDITEPSLGLANPAELAGSVNELWHLAAIYDLAVAEDFARRVNLEGTRHVLAFCRSCTAFDRLVYFSTAYVAGTRTGVVREDELVYGQSFKNHYEATKFAAEVLVRAAMDQGLPAVVIRPSIVVGDSRTGETDKFDGPYNAFKFLHKLRAVPLPMPLIGESKAHVNLVPVDFLVDASVAIARKRDAVGLTFHLVDPRPLTAAEVYDLACKLVTGRGAAPLSVPEPILEAALGFEPLRAWLGVQREVLTYFNHEARFDATNTLALLEGTGLRPPSPREYFPALYRFWLAHKDEAGFAAKA